MEYGGNTTDEFIKGAEAFSIAIKSNSKINTERLEKYDYINESIRNLSDEDLESIRKSIYTINNDCLVINKINSGCNTNDVCSYCKDVNCKYNTKIEFENRNHNHVIKSEGDIKYGL